MADELDAEKAARTAKRAAQVTVAAVAVAVVVLFIDQTIKRAVLAEAEGARRTLDQFRELVAKQWEVNHGGTTAAGETGSAPSPSVNGTGGVVDAPPAGAPVAKAAAPRRAASGRKPGSAAGRASRDG